MSTEALPQSRIAEDRMRRDRSIDIGGLILSAITIVFAIAAAFPIYWAVITLVQIRDGSDRQRAVAVAQADQYRGL